MLKFFRVKIFCPCRINHRSALLQSQLIWGNWAKHCKAGYKSCMMLMPVVSSNRNISTLKIQFINLVLEYLSSKFTERNVIRFSFTDSENKLVPFPDSCSHSSADRPSGTAYPVRVGCSTGLVFQETVLAQSINSQDST